MSERRRLSTQETLFWLFVCFTCSGASGLVYEVAWVRSLELIFGATTFAIATVLAAFMGGLALGSYVMGRTAQRFARYHPLVIYGFLECLIAVCGLLIPLIFGSLVPMYQWLWNRYHASFVTFSVIRFVLSVTVLLGPTFLMGATLPIVSSFVGAASTQGSKRIGWLYGFNTFGAVLGCVAAGLVLFPAIGLAKTQWVAIAFNLVAAFGGFALAARHRERALSDAVPASASAGGPVEAETTSVPVVSLEPPLAGGAMAQRKITGLLVAMYAVSGFVAMLYEVAWSRVLVLVLGSSTYAYTIMLATFLTGLALGAFLGTRLFGKTTQPLLAAGFCQFVIALTTYLGNYLVQELPYLYFLSYDYLRPSPRGLLLVQFLIATGLMIVPTLGLGAMFPVTIRGLSPSGDRTARMVGWAYALNTAGAILGSVMAGFFLVPKWGSQFTLLAGVGINALMGLFGMWFAGVGRLTRYRPALAALVLLFLGNLFWVASWEPYILSSGMFRYVRNYVGLDREKFLDRLRKIHGEILFFQEGLTCTVVVHRTPIGITLAVNGKPDASTPSDLPGLFGAEEAPRDLRDMPTQILVGQLPLLLAPQRDDVLIVGLGSGVTVGSVLRHPVREVECIELEEAVVHGSRYFESWNYRPLKDPRLKLIVNDARNHLLVTQRQYDVIISEPSNPWIPGAANLFTREFFEMAKTRLRPHGLFCQWVQLYELHQPDLHTILRTFLSVFPHVHLFRIGGDAVLVASLEPFPIRLDQLRARWTPAVSNDVARCRLYGIEEMLGAYWLGGQELRQNVRDEPLNTDDNMRIEFAAPLRVVAGYNTPTNSGLRLNRSFDNRNRGLIPHLEMPVGADAPAVWARLAEAMLRQNHLIEGKLYAEHSLSLKRTPAGARFYGDALYMSGKPDEAFAWWQKAEQEFPRAPEILGALAIIYAEREKWAETRGYSERLLKESPDDLNGRYLLGQSFYHLGQEKASLAALEPLKSAATNSREFKNLPFYLGTLNWNLGRLAEAIPHYELYLKRDPNHHGARTRLADALFRTGRFEEAAAQWQRMGQLRSTDAYARLEEGRREWDQGKREAARAKFEAAWQLDPWDDEVIFYLARARAATEDVNGAVQLVEKYLSWRPDRAWAIGFLSQLTARQGLAERSRNLAALYHSMTGLPWEPIQE